MDKFYSFFKDIGTFITSMALVVILLVPFMWYRFYEFHTLFIKWLPIEDLNQKETAAVMISLVFICVTLLFMVNIKRLFPKVNLLLAATAFILNIFFWSLKAEHNIWFIIFISVVIASMDYGLAHLFDNFWKEQEATDNLNDLRVEYLELNTKLSDSKQELGKLSPMIKEYQLILDKCTCKKCGFISGSPRGNNAHKCKI